MAGRKIVEGNNSPKKESFVFYRSFANTINRLPADIQLPLYKAITSYALDLIEPSFDDCQDRVFLEAIWESVRPQLYANHKRFLNGCKGAKYGELGGAPKGNQNARKKNQPQINPKSTPNVNDNVNVNVNDNVVIGKKTTTKTTSSNKFSIPSVEDVRVYCQSRSNSVDAEAFHSYYEANGWKVGKNPMKDWKAAVRTWERKEGQNILQHRNNQTLITNPKDIFK